MKKVLGLLFLLMFSFVGCQNKELSAPENVSYDYEGYIIWDEVENAEEYMINIGEQEYVTNIAIFDIKDIIMSSGTVEVEIIALADDYENSQPAIFTVNVVYNLNADIDFTLQGESLNWNEVYLANHYLISYGTQFFRVDGTSFDLSGLSSGTHDITVQAVFPDGSKTATYSIEFSN